MLTLTPHEFVDKWKQVTARERQTYQGQDGPRVQAIAQAGKELVEQWDRWLKADPTPSPSPKGRGEQRTLTNLYNARPTWLDLAHKRLDEAVFAAYGWESNLSDEEFLAKLLTLNLERAK